MKLREMMANKIYYSKVNDPNKWEGFPLAFECKNDEEAMKAEKLFNSLIQQLKEAREVIECLSKEYAKVIENEFSDSHEVLMVLPEEHMAYKKAQGWLKKYGEQNDLSIL